MAALTAYEIPDLTIGQIMARIDRHFLAADIWHAENRRALSALTLKLNASKLMGATSLERAAYFVQRKALLPSLATLKSEAVTYGEVDLAEAALRIARGAYVDADDCALQAILSYKAERDRGGYLIDGKAAVARRFIRRRSEARAKVHAAREAYEAVRAGRGFRMGRAA